MFKPGDKVVLYRRGKFQGWDADWTIEGDLELNETYTVKRVNTNNIEILESGYCFPFEHFKIKNNKAQLLAEKLCKLR